ncbi:unnamed protein product [Spodoptera littoralis]|uniref:Uncharacterized protein n=1 Tax=Spodoptera littoralis TaxID=7109 RepID=A0A9P0HWE3_SPOLI|nr:unnamed protein product [Spodoptera littoralis]CAH1635217.1 unnamed protein product [Spodoptera littoralis]
MLHDSRVVLCHVYGVVGGAGIACRGNWCEVREGRRVHYARRAPAPLWSRWRVAACAARAYYTQTVMGGARAPATPRATPRSARPRTTHP